LRMRLERSGSRGRKSHRGKRASRQRRRTSQTSRQLKVRVVRSLIMTDVNSGIRDT
jgi:hypothetical protein